MADDRMAFVGFLQKSDDGDARERWGRRYRRQTLMEADVASQLVSRYPVAVSAYP
jgi:hypothetical protein